MRTAAGGTAFVKAISAMNGGAGRHSREARITAALPPGAPAPRPLGRCEDVDRVVLVFEDVFGDEWSLRLPDV